MTPKPTLTFLVTFLMASIAQADVKVHKGMYAGFGLGTGKYLENPDAAEQYRAETVDFIGGYRFSDRVAVEARYRSIEDFTLDSDLKLEQSILGADLLMYMPPFRYNPKNGARFEPFVRGGVAQINRRQDGEFSTSPVELSSGIGAELTVPGGYGIRAEITDTGFDNTAATVSLVWHLEAGSQPRENPIYNAQYTSNQGPPASNLLDGSDYPTAQRLAPQRYLGQIKQALPKVGRSARPPQPSGVALGDRPVQVQSQPSFSNQPLGLTSAPLISDIAVYDQPRINPPSPQITPIPLQQAALAPSVQAYSHSATAGLPEDFPLPDYGPIEVQATASFANDSDYDGVSNQRDFCKNSVAKVVNNRGCAYEGPNDRIQFSPTQRISQEGHAVLRAVAREVVNNPGRGVRINLSSQSQLIAQQRAEIIRSTLRQAGVADPMIRIDNRVDRQNNRDQVSVIYF